MVGKCEDAETKNGCWAGELVTISVVNLLQNRTTEFTVKDTGKGLTHIPKLFLHEADALLPDENY